MYTYTHMYMYMCVHTHIVYTHILYHKKTSDQYLSELYVKFVNKILANQIQQYRERIIHNDHWNLFQVCKPGSIFVNQSMYSIISRN